MRAIRVSTYKRVYRTANYQKEKEKKRKERKKKDGLRRKIFLVFNQKYNNERGNLTKGQLTDDDQVDSGGRQTADSGWVGCLVIQYANDQMM